MMFSQLTMDIARRPAAHLLSALINTVPVVQMSGPHDAEVAGITTDSRRVSDRWMFVAVSGEHTDGHDHVQQAIERGASVVVVQLSAYRKKLKNLLSASYSQHNATTIVIVQDTRVAVAQLAEQFYGSPAKKLLLVGVTGTNGKTTTSFLVKSILEKSGRKTGLIGTIEYHIGKTVIPARFTTPPAEELHRILAEMVASGCTAAVMEVSSHALALQRVHGVQFDATIFTNLTQDHLDFHRTMAAYRDAKALLFSGHTRKRAILNSDDPSWERIGAGAGNRRSTYGSTGRPSFKLTSISSSARGTSVTLRHRGGETVITSPLIGAFNAYNLAAAFACGRALGIDADTIVAGLRRVKSVAGRFERITSADGVTAIVDYSHTPDALIKAIEAARGLLQGSGRIITVFGCGGDRDQTKRPLMGKAASRLSDLTIVTSDNPRSENPERIIDEIMRGVVDGADVERNAQRKLAIAYALRRALPGDIVLVAGKGHESTQQVGATRIHFDDREVVRSYFDEKRGGVKK
ncbi:MAG: UDP-N-acetylmuramoyl-L-alanyl-D-glutamate--2,6-diaminopimelate ligase [Ignavibacteria bacterium]|nr:UDP-N-acetylmuramoyl-L-alanyl-D-glutamate--2,6-diaminopimelate ligase [Ignavibacteria bacterium]